MMMSEKIRSALRHPYIWVALILGVSMFAALVYADEVGAPVEVVSVEGEPATIEEEVADEGPGFFGKLARSACSSATDAQYADDLAAKEAELQALSDQLGATSLTLGQRELNVKMAETRVSNAVQTLAKLSSDIGTSAAKVRQSMIETPIVIADVPVSGAE